jgi:3-oxoacyl-[acyl-carrier protein] reductase
MSPRSDDLPGDSVLISTRGSSMFEGQVVLVTGGGQGIGQAIALRFAREGADVAVVDVNRETAEAVGREVQALGRRSAIRVADISDCFAIQAAVQQIVAELGRIDVLINNAGVEKRAPFLEIRPEDWQRQLDVNLSGTFYCTQAAAREMAKRGYGRIVNISSVAGLIGPIDLAAYGVSKAGVIGLTRAAALDLADSGITVNCIAPGPVETELMLGAWSAEALRERPQHGAIPRFGTVDEIAHAAAFLAAPDSGFITGITVSVDGGAVAAGAYMVEKYRRRKAAATST